MRENRTLMMEVMQTIWSGLVLAPGKRSSGLVLKFASLLMCFLLNTTFWEVLISVD